MRVVILGNGIAGYCAAETIRKEDPAAEIVMISEERSSTYLRPLLSKTYIKAFQKEKICVQSDKWYQDNQITQMLGRTVERISLDRKEVLLDGDESIAFDRMVYALGADCMIPPFAGREKKGVMAVRSFRDFDQVRRTMYLAKHAVVIGGGVIGLEMAWELMQMGLEVTILEAGPRLMGRILDEHSGEILKEKLRDKNVTVETGVQIAKIMGGSHAEGVRLADGRTYPAELVVVSCGVRADIGPAKAAGISCDRGVLVNTFLQTSHPDVYAAGDCMQGDGPNPSLWGYAKESGALAGYNLCYPEAMKAFHPAVDPVILNVFGFSICSMGDVNGDSREESCKAPAAFRICEPESMQWSYDRRFYRDGKLCGAVLMGDLRRMETLKTELAMVQKGQEKDR